ncbi:alkene reductase [Kineococcus gynurae]|uniref:Alkene reductase n=1 Tax=Kineococcus gynurae TaxID=452979 RepID=A0ABV5LQ91_9ACTN
MEAANTSPAPSLFDHVRVGDLDLPNRLVMAPLTRLRSGADGVPGDLVAEYYRQRAGLGLIVTEGTYPSHEGRAYAGQPGIVTDEQTAAWGRVAEAVHGAGGRLFMQVMHGGRVSHPVITGTERIVAPSAVAIEGEVHTPEGKLPYPVPHALSTEEARTVVQEFVTASRRAVDAGLDGVEIHGANGYLLHEFLSPAANRRTDEFGGSPQARAGYVAEVVRAVVAELGAGRVGLRISPAHNIQDCLETDAQETAETYRALVEAIAPLGLAYLSVLHADPTAELVGDLRTRFGGPFLLNSGFGSVTRREDAQSLVRAGLADAVVVGRPVIANPDLAHRWANDLPENEPDASTFYGGGAEGYTDYPALRAS